MTESKLPFITLESLKVSKKDIKINSMYDLKMKIKDEELGLVLRHLTKKIVNCDIDPDVYFAVTNPKKVEELKITIDMLLEPKNSRKYDDNARHILNTIKFLLKNV